MKGVYYLQTFYSIMQSIHSVEDLIKKAKENKYNFVALSETENLYSMIKFINLCKKNEIKPIIGIKIYISLDFFLLNKKIGILIYALNDIGINNLIKISNLLKTQHRQINLEKIIQFQEGLFFILSNIDLFFSDILKPEIIQNILNKLKNSFKYFFLGLSLQSDYLEMFANVFLWISEKLNIKIVPTHKTNYLEKEDKEAYQLLLKLSNNKEELLKQKKHNFSFQFLNQHQFEKNYKIYFDNYQKNFLNSESFISKIKYENFLNYHYELPDLKKYFIIEKPFQYLKKITFDCFLKKIPNQNKNFSIYEKRLKKELKIIKKMSYEKYFLIVHDLVNYAKTKNILIGPGRGSSSSSLVCFFLGITEIDPIIYNLIFERFLNHQRNKMPDIDLDFPDDKIEIMWKYIIEKYGEKHVANILTFNTLTYKSILKEINLIKNKNNNNFSKDTQITDIFKNIKKLEGIPKFIGTHPAGIILSKKNLLECIPIQKNPQANCPFLYQTQLDIKQLDKIGLNKIDLLSLKSLTFIEKILIRIKERFEISWHNIELNNLDTFINLQKGKTEYIFQLESDNAKNILKKIKPKKFQDLVDVLALNRPGPISFINNYCEYKKNKKTKIIDDSIDFILIKTNGIILYQEQIMEIAFHFAGYNIGETETFMKSITSKNVSENELQNIKKNFLQKSQKKGRCLFLSNKIYNYIKKFSRYTFNKSHSVSYAMISYRMSYLKTNYFVFFFLVVLDENIKNSLITYNIMKKIKNKKIIFIKPNILESNEKYKFFENKILIPLTIIRNLNEDICSKIIKEREKKKFINFYDFKKRCKNILTNELLRDLIFVGVLDQFGFKKKTLCQSCNLDLLEHEKYLLSFQKKNQQQEEEYSSKYIQEQIIKAIGFNLNNICN
jgi:DNA polymerase-3 subunit alpha